MSQRMERRLLCTLAVLGVALAVASCRKPPGEQRAARRPAPELPKPELTTIPESLPENQKRLLRALNDAYPESLAEWEVERIDRQQMVEGAPENYQPAVQGTSVTISVSLLKPFFRMGERPLYRLEIHNVGSKRATLTEPAPSFIKFGDAFGDEGISGFEILISTPGGMEVAADIPLHFGPSDPFGGFGPDAPWESGKGEEIRNKYLLQKKAHALFINLLPGELLTAHTWGRTVGGGYGVRELPVESELTQPGTYRLRIKAEQSTFDSQEPIFSNIVSFEVVR